MIQQREEESEGEEFGGGGKESVQVFEGGGEIWWLQTKVAKVDFAHLFFFWSGQKTFEKRQDNASQCIEGLLGKLYSWPWPDCPSIISPSHHLK